MALTEQELKNLHKLSFHHRAKIEASQQCGCFYCLNRFGPKEIEDWVDGEQTARCPHCFVDSVLPDQPTDEILAAMRERWFNGE